MKKFEVVFERKVELTQWHTVSIEAKSEEEALKISKEMSDRLHIDVADDKWHTIHEHTDTTNQKVFAINKKRVTTNQ